MSDLPWDEQTLTEIVAASIAKRDGFPFLSDAPDPEATYLRMARIVMNPENGPAILALEATDE